VTIEQAGNLVFCAVFAVGYFSDWIDLTEELRMYIEHRARMLVP
jgi:hypothetical protein